MFFFFLSCDVLLRRKQKWTNPPQAVWKLWGSLKKKRNKKHSEDGLSSSLSRSSELHVTDSQSFILWCTFSLTSIKYWRLRSGKKDAECSAELHLEWGQSELRVVCCFFLWLVHCCICAVVLLPDFLFLSLVLILLLLRGGKSFAKSGHVSRSLCAFATNKQKLHPDFGPTLTL